MNTVIKIADYIKRTYHRVPEKHAQLYQLCTDWERYQQLEFEPEQVYDINQLEFKKEVNNE
jgi:hypothetical protein